MQACIAGRCAVREESPGGSSYGKLAVRYKATLHIACINESL